MISFKIGLGLGGFAVDYALDWLDAEKASNTEAKTKATKRQR
jgi:hypothetical protein